LNSRHRENFWRWSKIGGEITVIAHQRRSAADCVERCQVVPQLKNKRPAKRRVEIALPQLAGIYLRDRQRPAFPTPAERRA
jgi:hypothetical protein